LEFGITPVLVTAEPTGIPKGAEVLDPREPGKEVETVLDDVLDRWRSTGKISADQGVELRNDPLLIGVSAVRSGRVQGCVAGAARPSAEVARAALRVVGLEPGRTVLSSTFVMVLPDGRFLGYGDCAVVPEPSAEQLAEIAVCTAETFEDVVGEKPIIAMLSFSTKGSASHSTIDSVREATRIVTSRWPHLTIDGELQFDAAISETVGKSKAPGSPAAGRANVLIFPNLAAGNIAYKATERLAGAEALGPLLQGLSAPVNDLSRGCKEQDIVNISMITGTQALRRLDHALVGGG
jgi:phosphotransacetylase